MPALARYAATILLASCLALLFGCDDNNDDDNQQRDYLPINQPAVELPPDAGQPNLLTTTFDLASVGYQQREYFLSGTATALSNTNELATDGRWEAEPGAQAQYKTRVLVYRPSAEADYSGTVYVEWLNVTAGFETPPSWGSGHTEILRAGHAWVGVSAQFVGIEGSPRGLLPLHLKAVNPARYGSLVHPGDSYSYDMFSQVAQALRQPGAYDLLEGLPVEHLLAVGESQSASRLTTYVNAVHPLYNPYDGYLLHSRGRSSSPLSQSPEVEIAAPEVVNVRTDLNVPVLNFQTETDVLGAATARQDDNQRFRLWEVAGTAHGDHYSFVSGRADSGTGAEFAVVVENDSVLGFIKCDRPINAGPMAWVFNASLNALQRWVAEGKAPPKAPRIGLTDDGSQFLKDDNGNVKGGIRTSYVDAAPAVLSGEPNTGGSFCRLFGTTALFDAATMASLYVDKAGYMEAVAKATDDAVAKGFLLEADGQRIKDASALQWDRLDD